MKRQYNIPSTEDNITAGDDLLAHWDEGSTRDYLERSTQLMVSLVGKALRDRPLQERREYMELQRDMTNFELRTLRATMATIRNAARDRYRKRHGGVLPDSIAKEIESDLRRSDDLQTMEAHSKFKLQWLDVLEEELRIPPRNTAQDDEAQAQGHDAAISEHGLNDESILDIGSLQIPVAPQSARDRHDGRTLPGILAAHTAAVSSLAETERNAVTQYSDGPNEVSLMAGEPGADGDLVKSVSPVSPRDEIQIKASESNLKDPDESSALAPEHVASNFRPSSLVGAAVHQAESCPAADKETLATAVRSSLDKRDATRFALPHVLAREKIKNHCNVRKLRAAATAFVPGVPQHTMSDPAMVGPVTKQKQQPGIDREDCILIDVSEETTESHMPQNNPAGTTSAEDETPILIDISDPNATHLPVAESSGRTPIKGHWDDLLGLNSDTPSSLMVNWGNVDLLDSPAPASNLDPGTSNRNGDTPHPDLIDLGEDSALQTTPRAGANRSTGRSVINPDDADSGELTPISKFAQHPRVQEFRMPQMTVATTPGQNASMANTQRRRFDATYTLRYAEPDSRDPMRPRGRGHEHRRQTSPSGLLYVTAPGKDDGELGCQAVVLSGLPLEAKLCHVMARVRGGKIVQATMVDTTALQAGLSAYVVFADASEAEAYVKFAQENQGHMVVLGQQAHVSLAGTATYPRHGMREPQGDQTRCLKFGWVPSTIHGDVFRHVESMFGRAEDALEDVWYDEDRSFLMLFKNLDYAIRFYNFVRRFPDYSYVAEDMNFTDDPCSGPLQLLTSPSRLARGRGLSLLEDYWLAKKYPVNQVHGHGCRPEPHGNEKQGQAARPSGGRQDHRPMKRASANVEDVDATEPALATMPAKLIDDTSGGHTHKLECGAEPSRESKKRDCTGEISKPPGEPAHPVSRVLTMQQFLNKYDYEGYQRDPEGWRQEFPCVGNARVHEPMPSDE